MSTSTMIIFLCTSCLIVSSASEDIKITPIKTSSGLYYEKIGDVLLTNSKWEFVTSVDYRGYLLFYEYLFNQAKKIEEICQNVKLTECNSRYDSIRSNLDRIQERDESMASFLGITKPRVKRFWDKIGNFFSKLGKGIVGVVGSIFGGGSNRADLSAYDRQLGDLRNGQTYLNNQLNLQRTMFLLDSERKRFQIDWLKKTQDDIQNKVSTLEGTFQEDSQNKEKKIKEMKAMLDETQKKLKMQEEIQKQLGDRLSKIETKLLKVDKDIKNINKQVEDNQNKIEHLDLVTKLNSISIDFSFLISQFDSEQKTLFEVIKNANKGDLDPYILTPLKLVEMLQDIQVNLPEDMRFPFFPHIENANKLYNIIKPSVYLYNSKVIFILQIPLVHAKTYRIHKITILPQQSGLKKFIFIQPQQPFLIIDKNYEEYALMSSSDFRDFCKKIGESKYLCNQVSQFSLAYKNQECEVSLFKTPKSVPSSCDTRLIHLNKPIFLQLQQPKAWVYVVPDVEIVTFICGKNRSTVRLEGAGFIEVIGDCLVRTQHFELLSLLEFSNPVESNYSAPLNLAEFIDKSYVEEVEETSGFRKQVILPFDFEQLNKNSVSLKRPKASLAALYYTMSVVIIFIMCVFGYLIYKKKIDLRQIRNVISNIRKRNNSSAQNETSGKVQIRLKLNKDDDNIRKISVREGPSTDPDSEYITVRFKVKKEESKQNQLNALNNKSNCNKNQINLVNKNVFPGSSAQDFCEDDNYLNQLRKLKPEKNLYC